MHQLKLPFGPQHPALLEAVHLELTVDEEIVKNVRFKIGYNHRGIEKALEGKEWNKGMYLAERICGFCGTNHSTCFVNGVEAALGLEIPERAKYIRVVMLELERIQSHLMWLGIFAHELGFDTLFMYALRDREHINDILEMVSGNRIHQSMVTIGGVRLDILQNMFNTITEKLNIIKRRNTLYKQLVSDLKVRTKGIGVLKKNKAFRLNVVGPVARGSDIAYDIRKVDPCLVYGDLKFKVITREAGDSYARLLVRLDEIDESIKILRQCLTDIPKGAIKKRPVFKFKNSEIMARIEPPRGELVYYIRVGKDQTKPERVKIRTPTLANLHVIKPLIVNHNIADVPVVVASLDPCFGCADRLTVIDQNTGDKKIITKEELLCHHEH